MMVKNISFPECEIPSLIGRSTLVTHRVSRDHDKYHVGDIVEAPWGDLYCCVKRLDLTDIEDSPFIEHLTEDQIELLSEFPEIAVLWFNLES